MTRKFIPVEESFAEWQKDAEYLDAFDALEEEFALADELIAARTKARLTQEEVAKRMGTTQPAVARLEGGLGKPTLRTLERYARATGTRLRVRFEAEPPTRADRRQAVDRVAHRQVEGHARRHTKTLAHTD
jgi:transcriptional regulator with XRE-family HTH domain